MDGDIFNQGEYLNPTGSGQWVYDGDFFIEPGLAQEPAEENNPSAVDYGGLAVLPTLSYPTVDVDYQLGAFGLVSWPTAPLQPHASNTWHLSPGEPGNSSTAMGANLIPYDQSQVWTANDLTGFALGRQYRPLPRGVVETSQTALTTASPHLPQVSSPASARLSASRTYGVQGAMVKARSLSYTTKLFEVKLDGQLSTANGSQGSFGALVGYHRGEGLYKVESTGRCAFRQLDGDSCSDRVFLAEKSGGKLIAAIATPQALHELCPEEQELLRSAPESKFGACTHGSGDCSVQRLLRDEVKEAELSSCESPGGVSRYKQWKELSPRIVICIALQGAGIRPAWLKLVLRDVQLSPRS